MRTSLLSARSFRLRYVPLVSGLALLLALAAAPAPAAPQANTTLRSAARVATAQITLGDLFDNAGGHAEDVVAAAPPPGASLLFESAWLAATAHKYDLAWQPPSTQTSIRVQRAARTVDNAELGDQLTRQLGLGQAKTQLVFDTQYRVVVPEGSSPGYGIEHVELNQATSRVTAELRVPADDQAATPIRISGRVVAMIDVPVLAHPMVPGDQLATA